MRYHEVERLLRLFIAEIKTESMVCMYMYVDVLQPREKIAFNIHNREKEQQDFSRRQYLNRHLSFGLYTLLAILPSFVANII